MTADSSSPACQARLAATAATAATDARDRIRAVSPDVMTAIERIEARHGTRYADADLRTLSRTEEFIDEYRRVCGVHGSLS